MHKMTLKTTRFIATMVLTGLLAANVATADDQDAVADSADATTTAELNRRLAESANTAAVEEAVAAVLAETRLDLDIRFIGRTSLKIADGR